MRLTVSLTDSPSQVQKKILDCCADVLNEAVRKASGPIQNRVRNKIEEIIKQSNEYRSLVGGALMMDFGLSNPITIVDNLITIWKNEIAVNINMFRTRGSNIIGAFTIDAIDGTFKNALGSPYATYLSNGYPINWLDWLLLEGTASVVKGYEVVYAPSPLSRSGLALMRPVIGGKFGVNPAYAGTKTNNFITRAMDSSESEFLDIIQEEVERAI